LNNYKKSYIAITGSEHIAKVRRRLYTQGRVDSATHPYGADEEVF
jgi:hypothetical protein